MRFVMLVSGFGLLGAGAAMGPGRPALGAPTQTGAATRTVGSTTDPATSPPADPGAGGGSTGGSALSVITTPVTFDINASGQSPASADSHTGSAAVASSGAIDEQLIGFNGPGPGGAAPALKALHPAWIRTDANLDGSDGDQPVYDCATGHWDSGPLDQRLAAIKALGARTELIIDYMPACLVTRALPAGASPTHELPDPGPNTQSWQALVTEVAEHVIRQFGVDTFEVWNEPDWAPFWSGTTSDYIQLYAMTASALEKAASATHRSIEVGGPALANVTGTMDSGFLDQFLTAVLAQNLPLDFLSWHVYANDPYAGPSDGFGPICPKPAPKGQTAPCYYNPDTSANIYELEAAQAEAALAPFSSLHPALWVDEWNLDAESDPRQEGPYGAAFALAALDAAQTGGIQRMCFFDVADSPTDKLHDWGILDGSLQPKPSYSAFADWLALAGRQLPVSQPGPPGSDNHSNAGVVASMDRTRKVHIALWDFVPFDPSANDGTSLPTPIGNQVSLQLSGLAKKTVATISRVTGPPGYQPVLSVSTSAGGNLEISVDVPEDSTILITLTQPKLSSSQYDVVLPAVAALGAVVVLGLPALWVRRSLRQASARARHGRHSKRTG